MRKWDKGESAEGQQQLQTSKCFPQMTREQVERRRDHRGHHPRTTCATSGRRHSGWGRGTQQRSEGPTTDAPACPGDGCPKMSPRPPALCSQDAPGLPGPAASTVPHLEPRWTASLSRKQGRATELFPSTSRITTTFLFHSKMHRYQMPPRDMK